MKRLRLYSRPGCHLCELLYDDLEPLLAGRAIVEHVDISDDKNLLRRYGLRIPVLCADDLELSAYPLDVGKVTAFLATP